MRYPTVRAPLALWKAAVVAGALATSAAFAGTASAAVFVINPPAGNTGVQNGALLATAITNANNSTDPSSTIVLKEASYNPSSPFPAIQKNLRIVGDHTNQELNGGTNILGASLSPSDQTLITINAGATLTLEALKIGQTGTNPGNTAAVVDNGNLVMHGADLLANLSPNQLLVNSGGTATLNNSLVGDGSQGAIDIELGTVTLNHSNVTFNGTGAITQNGTLNVNNSIISNNDLSLSGLPNCTSPANSSDHSLDSDGSCGLTTAGGSKSGTTASPLNAGIFDANKNGGPVQTNKFTSSTSPAVGAANQTNCPVADNRFFAFQGSTKPPCDMGSLQSGATQDTTPPACVSTGKTQNAQGQNVTQTVSLTDSISGLGPEGGSISDPINAGAPPLVGNNQADVVDGATIDNGGVSATGFSSGGPSTSPVTLTATKSNLGALAHWSFTATNWAGVTKFCS